MDDVLERGDGPGVQEGGYAAERGECGGAVRERVVEVCAGAGAHIDPEAETIEQFIASSRGYPPEVPKQKTEEITSAAVAGFVIPVRAVFNQSANLAAARQLLASEPRKT